jgi:single-strand DNA-binding protein
MLNISNVVLTGRLAWDPDVRRAASGTVWGTFSLAVNHRYKTKNGESREDVAFIRGKTFNGVAEGLEGLKKGNMIMVAGHFITEKWEKGGENHSQMVLICDSVFSVIMRNGPACAAEEKLEGESADDKDDEGKPPF